MVVLVPNSVLKFDRNMRRTMSTVEYWEYDYTSKVKIKNHSSS
jgi:hypothetical protein